MSKSLFPFEKITIENQMIETTKNETLKQAVTSQIQNYFNELKGQKVTDLYDMLIEQVEVPLFDTVMEDSK